jgi:hypothetical protein
MKKVFSAIRNKFCDSAAKIRCRMTDRKGDLAVNTIGGIIIAVVLIGLLIVAIRAFFPSFFTAMFNSMQQKLNANW